MNANEPVFLSCGCKSLLGDDPKTRMNFDRFGVTNGDFRAFEKKERERRRKYVGKSRYIDLPRAEYEEGEDSPRLCRGRKPT